MCCWKRSHFCFVPTRDSTKNIYLIRRNTRNNGYKKERKKNLFSSKFKTRRNVLSVNPIFVSFIIWRRHTLSITLFLCYNVELFYQFACYFRSRKKFKKISFFKHSIIVEVCKVWMLWERKIFYQKKSRTILSWVQVGFFYI